MKTTTGRWTNKSGWTLPDAAPQLVLYFGATSLLDAGAPAVRELAAKFPGAVVCGCSTAGEILGSRVFDESIVAAIVQFQSTQVRAVAESTAGNADSRRVGRCAAEKLTTPDLRHVLILSDGLSVNGTALVAGFREILAPDMVIVEINRTSVGDLALAKSLLRMGRNLIIVYYRGGFLIRSVTITPK